MALIVLLFLVTVSASNLNSTIRRPSQYGNNEIFDSTYGTKDGTAKFHVPYIVSIQSTIGNGYEHLCAGTIIDESFVLTAAHCFYKVNKPEKLSIMAGSNILLTAKAKGIRHEVSKIIQHQNFVPLTGPDIALLKVNPNFKIDDKKIGIININSSRSIYKTNAWLIGWGAVKKNLYPKLEVVSFNTIHSNKCRRQGFIYVKNTEICAISYRGRGACDGDSGGPLVNPEFNIQIGLLSYGRTPCMKGRIYAFTNLSKLKDWIFESVKKYR